VVRLDTLELETGSLPRRALALVLEWASLHRAELRQNWGRAQTRQPLTPSPRSNKGPLRWELPIHRFSSLRHLH